MAGEGEEDDKPEQHREAGGEHAEEAGRAVAVVEVAALGRAAADEQHRRDRHARDDPTTMRIPRTRFMAREHKILSRRRADFDPRPSPLTRSV